MLPGINYLDLSDDELDEELVDLECNTQEILCRLSVYFWVKVLNYF